MSEDDDYETDLLNEIQQLRRQRDWWRGECERRQRIIDIALGSVTVKHTFDESHLAQPAPLLMGGLTTPENSVSCDSQGIVRPEET